MDEKRQRMRASDRERQDVVEVLKVALDDGRLKMDEYVERMEKAYEAVTIGELALLRDDLPDVTLPAARDQAAVASTTPAAPRPTPAQVSLPAVPPDVQKAYTDLPIALKVLWTIWFAAVSINVVVWALVGVTSGSVPYPWPLWVAGPSGAALFGVSAPVVAARRAKRARRQLPPSA